MNLYIVLLAVTNVVTLAVLLLGTYNKRYNVPPIKVMRTHDPINKYVATLRGGYMYEGRGKTRAESIGELVRLIDKLKHNNENILDQ